MEITEADIWSEIDKYITALPPIEDTDITKEMVMQRYGVSERSAHRHMKDIAKDGAYEHIQVRSGKGQKPWVLRGKSNSAA